MHRAAFPSCAADGLCAGVRAGTLCGMAHRRDHYDRAFESFLRARRIPYVAVDEARKTLLPRAGGAELDPALKSFDFVIYGESGNLLVDVKGRRVSGRGTRLESWVTLDDVESLRRWESLFGAGFEAAFVFMYWWSEQPADALFQEVIEHREQWYALRAVRVGDYARVMKQRSARWRTVDVQSREFARISHPFVGQPFGGDGRGSDRAYDPPRGLDIGPEAPAIAGWSASPEPTRIGGWRT